MTGTEAERLVKARICAANNADWYQCVFRAHGLADVRTASHWQSQAAVPPYYSNLVTLSPDDREAQMAAIRELDADLRQVFSLKDAFSNLPLDAMGFTPLFDAEWIWLAADAAPVSSKAGWERIATAPDLALWEHGWNGSSPAEMRVFLPSMLANPDVGFFGRQENGHYVAGCIGNRSRDCVGFSNFFAPSADSSNCMKSAVAAVASFGAGLPVVGYERGQDLETAQAAGFQCVGNLRIWLSRPQKI